MSTVLLIVLFSLLCLAQWFFSKNNFRLFRYLPTGLYLLITGIAVIRTIADGTFSAGCRHADCRFGNAAAVGSPCASAQTYPPCCDKKQQG